MLITHPDFTRRIDLQGAGPCPRPINVDGASTSFTRLVALRVYTFAQGLTIDGEAEEDEVFIVVMHGLADITISQDGYAADTVALRRDGGSRAVYMPPHAAYRLIAVTDCDIAYARAQPIGFAFAATREFALHDRRLDVVGHATGMDLTLIAIGTGDAPALADAGHGAERFLHVRAAGAINPAITVALGAERLTDWDAAALSESDMPALAVDAGAGEVLVITAAAGPRDGTMNAVTRVTVKTA